MPKTTSKNYRQLNEELSQILDWFESAEADVDEAIAKYEQAVKLIAQIEEYLKTAENKLKKLKVDLQ